MCVCMCVRARVGQGSTLGIILQVPSTWFYEPGTGLGSPSIGPCLLASRPKQSACFHLPSVWVTSMNHHAHLCACAISICEGGPSTGTESGSEAMLGFPVSELEENRLHSFKQEREEGKKRRAEGKGEGDKEGKGRRRTGKEMFECICYWANRRNMQNRQRNSIFPRRFLINTNKTWIIFPIKMNAFSKHVHW